MRETLRITYHGHSILRRDETRNGAREIAYSRDGIAWFDRAANAVGEAEPFAALETGPCS